MVSATRLVFAVSWLEKAWQAVASREVMSKARRIAAMALMDLERTQRGNAVMEDHRN